MNSQKIKVGISAIAMVLFYLAELKSTENVNVGVVISWFTLIYLLLCYSLIFIYLYINKLILFNENVVKKLYIYSIII